LPFRCVTFEGVGLNATINIEVADGIRWNEDTRYIYVGFAVTLKIHMNHYRFINTGGGIAKMIHVTKRPDVVNIQHRPMVQHEFLNSRLYIFILYIY